jgi:hypothetical protein
MSVLGEGKAKKAERTGFIGALLNAVFVIALSCLWATGC